MSNPYYNFTDTFVSDGTAKSADLNTEFLAITDAFAAVNVLIGNGIEYDNGNSGTAITINPANGIFQKVTLNAATPAITISVATAVGHYHLKIVQDGSGGRLPSWVGFTSGQCVGNAFPTIASAVAGVTFMTLYWDGTLFWVSTTNWD